VDPNKVLAEILQLRKDYVNEPSHEKRHDIVWDLLDAFDNLDRWLNLGGFLPERWAQRSEWETPTETVAVPGKES
jgi:hypothetical protein